MRRSRVATGASDELEQQKALMEKQLRERAQRLSRMSCRLETNSNNTRSLNDKLKDFEILQMSAQLEELHNDLSAAAEANQNQGSAAMTGSAASSGTRRERRRTACLIVPPTLNESHLKEIEAKEGDSSGQYQGKRSQQQQNSSGSLAASTAISFGLRSSAPSPLVAASNLAASVRCFRILHCCLMNLFCFSFISQLFFYCLMIILLLFLTLFLHHL